ncbi:synaptonemal complex protein 2-like isoform X2 [Mangifera indica]|uniref:synaptonemal complex protein 2-like isoform X2 n=1 Tax=Mangifera indica TaxID=29780 RepID=UPI001CFA507E|nr:synaptonemal complex protein 2-like isoform X2 [Mangifera indica]
MQKLGFQSIKSLDQLKSLSGTARTFAISSRPSSDSITSGSFSNLKLTAEKLVKEQASVKTDLEMANSKLKKSLEHIHELEEKLQNAFNENAKLKVKQKEDEKLWKGLESKFSSTQTLCDQLTETLQHLAGQVQNAEKDKEFFEEKLSASMKSIDILKQHIDGLSLKLGSAEELIRDREKEIRELKIEGQEKDKLYRDEQCRTANIIEEKDAVIMKFEEFGAANKLEIESLNSKLGELHLELRSKEDKIELLIVTQDKLEKEKGELHMSKDVLEKKLVISLQEVKDLEGFLHVSAGQLVELDKQSLTFIEKFYQLNSLYDSFHKLIQEERDLAGKQAQRQYDQLHDGFLCITSEKDALQLVNQGLENKIIELQKSHESVMVQLSVECQVAKEKIQRLETEAEALISKKIETESLVSKMEKEINTLSESSRSSENKMQDLLMKISSIESENNCYTDELQAEIQKKEVEIVNLQQESKKRDLHVDSLEKQVGQLQNMLEEKEQLLLQYRDGEKKLKDQITENLDLLTAADSKLAEAKKQYDLMLESKQLELSRHLKEISQRNDQAINDIRRKYEVEKQDIVNMEKEKADRAVEEMETKFDQKLAECKEEAKLQLVHIHEEHAALVIRIQQEHDRKDMNLKAEHNEDLKRIQLQAEIELREKTTSLRNEHEVQMKALRCQHEDECRKLLEELDLQKSKEDRQRALLQLQWRVMSDKPQDDQEVNSKKDYSISSIKMRDTGVGQRISRRSVVRGANEEKGTPFLDGTQTPVSKLLEDVNTGTIMSMPKHHKKVTRHEYEVETSNGRTITKRRKSTVMFEDPRKHKKRNTPKARTPRSIVTGFKGGANPHPSNIGDLFSEGSLNPYADDPYAFD